MADLPRITFPSISSNLYWSDLLDGIEVTQ